MSSKRGKKAKKRSQREARRQTRRAQRGTEVSSTPRASSTQSPSTPPTTDSQPRATLLVPAYVLQTWEDCWDCLLETKIFALAAEGIESMTPAPSKLDRFVLMTSMEWLSPDLQEFLKKHSHSAFSLDESIGKDGCWQYINHCSHCGAAFDNDQLFESGEAFSPEYEDECEYTVIRVPDGIDLRITGKTATPPARLFLPRP